MQCCSAVCIPFGRAKFEWNSSKKTASSVISLLPLFVSPSFKQEMQSSARGRPRSQYRPPSETEPLSSVFSNFPSLIFSQMASVIHQSQKRPTDAYGCNWLERLRQIKRVHTKAVAENFAIPSSPMGKVSPSLGGRRPPSLPVTGLTDFTEYIMK